MRPLCHEVGNILAAIRISGHLMGTALGAEDRAKLAFEVESLAAQAGALLAQVRSLLADDRSTRVRVSMPEILAAVRRSAEDRAAPGVQLSVSKGRGLPDVRVDPDALHHCLVALVLGALEAVGPRGRVRLSAQTAGRRVLLALADDGPSLAPEDFRFKSRLHGRALALQVADAVLRRTGGRAALGSVRRGTRIEFVLPAVRSASRRAPARKAG